MSEIYSCQKLLKSDNFTLSYNQKCPGCFFSGDDVYSIMLMHYICCHNAQLIIVVVLYRLVLIFSAATQYLLQHELYIRQVHSTNVCHTDLHISANPMTTYL